MVGTWKFRLTRQEGRSRRLILEGQAYPPYERPYHDELFIYLVLGSDYLSLEVSRDFDGDRLLAYFFGLLGEPRATAPLPGNEWRFCMGGSPHYHRRKPYILTRRSRFPPRSYGKRNSATSGIYI